MGVRDVDSILPFESGPKTTTNNWAIRRNACGGSEQWKALDFVAVFSIFDDNRDREKIILFFGWNGSCLVWSMNLIIVRLL